jgi:hypothetical protein
MLEQLPTLTSEVEALSMGWRLIPPEESRTLRIGKIHSRFSGAINILFSDGMLASIVNADVSPGPFNIVVGLPKALILGALELTEGQDVYLSPDNLIVGDLRIDIGSAPVYRSRHGFADSLLEPFEIEDNISRLIDMVLAEGRAVKSDFFKGEIYSRVDLLLKGVLERDAVLIESAAGSLVGMGRGLTPSADDILSGFMLAYYLFSENLKGDLVGAKRDNSIIASLSDQTTLLSSRYLREAALGNGTETAVSLVEKLLTSRKAGEVESATRLMLLVGATSGTEGALGIALGSVAALKMIGGANRK